VENAAYHAHHHGRQVISCDDLPTSASRQPSPGGLTFHERVHNFKRHIVEEALAQCEGSQVRAARMLGLDRGTLRRIVGRSSLSQ
jgi:transcriptional regulator with GAF, ATPase, and Fis domain